MVRISKRQKMIPAIVIGLAVLGAFMIADFLSPVDENRRFVESQITNVQQCVELEGNYVTCIYTIGDFVCGRVLSKDTAHPVGARADLIVRIDTGAAVNCDFSFTRPRG